MSKKIFMGPAIYVPYNKTVNLFDELNHKVQIPHYTSCLFFNLFNNPALGKKSNSEFFAIVDADEEFHQNVGSIVEEDNNHFGPRFIYPNTSYDSIKSFKSHALVKPYLEVLKASDVDYELVYIASHFYKE